MHTCTYFVFSIPSSWQLAPLYGQHHSQTARPHHVTLQPWPLIADWHHWQGRVKLSTAEYHDWLTFPVKSRQTAGRASVGVDICLPCGWWGDTELLSLLAPLVLTSSHSVITEMSPAASLPVGQSSIKIIKSNQSDPSVAFLQAILTG